MRRQASAMVLVISLLLASCELIAISAPKSTKFPLAELTDLLDSTSGPPAGSYFRDARQFGQTLLVLYGNFQSGDLELLALAPGTAPIQVSLPGATYISDARLLVSDGQVRVASLSPSRTNSDAGTLRVAAIDLAAGTTSPRAPALELATVSLWSVAVSGNQVFFSGGHYLQTGSWDIYERVSSGDAWDNLIQGSYPQVGYGSVSDALFVTGDGTLHKIGYSDTSTLVEYSLGGATWNVNADLTFPLFTDLGFPLSGADFSLEADGPDLQAVLHAV